MAHRITTSVDIVAPASRVWFVMTDVEAMPAWTESMTSVTLEPEGPLAPGSRARVVQPKLSPTTWTVTELTPGESFAWQSRSLGTTLTATHLIEAAKGHVTVHLAVEFTGPGAWLARTLAGGLTQQYVELEAAGLKRACETHRS